MEIINILIFQMNAHTNVFWDNSTTHIAKTSIETKQKRGEESDVYELHQAQRKFRSVCFPVIFSFLKKLRIALVKRHRYVYSGSL